MVQVDGMDRFNKNCLIKVTLPSSKSNELLRFLYKLDITPHHLMPTLDNVANAYSYTQKLFIPKETDKEKS